MRKHGPEDKLYDSPTYDMDDPFLTEFLGLLLVCKQVRQESAGLVLEANTLHMCITRWNKQEDSALAAIPNLFRSNQASVRLRVHLAPSSLPYSSGPLDAERKARLNAGVGRICRSLHPGRLTVVLGALGGVSLCDCPEVDDLRKPSYKFELQANDDGAGLVALKTTFAWRKKEIQERPRHDPWCSSENEDLKDMLEATSVAEELMRSLEKAYSEAASNNGNSAGLANDE